MAEGAQKPNSACASCCDSGSRFPDIGPQIWVTDGTYGGHTGLSVSTLLLTEELIPLDARSQDISKPDLPASKKPFWPDKDNLGWQAPGIMIIRQAPIPIRMTGIYGA